MLDRIYKLTGRPFNYKIEFHYENCYGTFMVNCIIDRNWKQKAGKIIGMVKSTAKSEEEALDKAEKLLDKLGKLQSIVTPSLDKQTNPYGYYREMICGSTEIEFQRIGNRYVVTNIYKKDGDFYILDEPTDIPLYFKYERDLLDGEKLYTWDTIRALSGSYGEAIVKDGKVIKRRGIGLS